MASSKTACLLVQTLFTLMNLQIPQSTSQETKHVLDALSTVLANWDVLRKIVLDLIAYQESLYHFSLTK